MPKPVPVSRATDFPPDVHLQNAAERAPSERTEAQMVLAAADAALKAGQRQSKPTANFRTAEVKAFRLAMKGLSDCEIAGRLFVSQTTVHQGIEAVRRKLGASTRAAAFQLATRFELFEET